MLSILTLPGCGAGGGSSSTDAGPLKDREAIVAALPKGITLETSIEPNPMLGPNSKTVGEALTSLQAYVRDGKIYDGGLGHEIRFDEAADPKKAARPGKQQAPTTVIKVRQ